MEKLRFNEQTDFGITIAVSICLHLILFLSAIFLFSSKNSSMMWTPPIYTVEIFSPVVQQKTLAMETTAIAANKTVKELSGGRGLPPSVSIGGQGAGSRDKKIEPTKQTVKEIRKVVPDKGAIALKKDIESENAAILEKTLQKIKKQVMEQEKETIIQKRIERTFNTLIDKRIAQLKIDIKKREILAKGIVTIETAMSSKITGGLANGANSELIDLEKNTYLYDISERIKDVWIYNGISGELLRAVIIIKIDRKGNILEKRFEKRSLNSIFDQSAMKAIDKALPLPPFPDVIEDMVLELGIRFCPNCE